MFFSGLRPQKSAELELFSVFSFSFVDYFSNVYRNLISRFSRTALSESAQCTLVSAGFMIAKISENSNYFLRSGYPKVLLKEGSQLCNDPLLLGRSLASSPAKPRDGRHELINICPCGLQGSIPERVVKEALGFFWLELLRLNDLAQDFLFLLGNESMPISVYYGGGVHGVNKAVNRLFRTAQLNTGL